MKLKIVFVSLLGLLAYNAHSQFLMDMIDTTKDLGKSNRDLIKRFDKIRISGYIQPQFQVASSKGASSYQGGDFSALSNNRFMLRRGRIRFDYVIADKEKRNNIQFVLQFEGSERGVLIRDFWGRVWEHKFELFAFTTGMFARPFGYEVNLSSSDRESPERGRMSQILMKTERDLGFMVSLENRKKGAKFDFLRLDAGIFNGQGLSGTTDFDSHKDFISQLVVKPIKLGKTVTISGGVSYYKGGLLQVSNATYRIKSGISGNVFSADSVTSVAGKILPREYYGLNAQLKKKTALGTTELRGEFWKGVQTATAQTSETPGTIPAMISGKYPPYYVRNFRGGFFYFLQQLGSAKHQLGVKYDWYDPNTKVSGSQIGKSDLGYTAADIKFKTLGFGYINYLSENLKLVFWYDLVKNENTSLTGYTQDKKDNIFTLRAQFRF